HKGRLLPLSCISVGVVVLALTAGLAYLKWRGTALAQSTPIAILDLRGTPYGPGWATFEGQQLRTWWAFHRSTIYFDGVILAGLGLWMVAIGFGSLVASPVKRSEWFIYWRILNTLIAVSPFALPLLFYVEPQVSSLLHNTWSQLPIEAFTDPTSALALIN